MEAVVVAVVEDAVVVTEAVVEAVVEAVDAVEAEVDVAAAVEEVCSCARVAVCCLLGARLSAAGVPPTPSPARLLACTSVHLDVSEGAGGH